MPSREPDEEAIFHVAREISSLTVRSDYLDQACGGDAELRARVDALLDAHDEPDSFLKQSPAAELAASVDHQQSTPITEGTGTVIANYRLLQQIGEGGIGDVYMTEQLRPVRRKVALKIIKPGMDSRAVVARFEAERQALALMDHPNIAHVLDGGATDSARP